MDKVRARMLKPDECQKLHRMRQQSTNLVNSRRARIILLSEVASRMLRSGNC